MAERSEGQTVSESDAIKEMHQFNLPPDRDEEAKCGRSSCKAPGATFWNPSTRDWYCEFCANKLNHFSPGLCIKVEPKK